MDLKYNWIREHYLSRMLSQATASTCIISTERKSETKHKRVKSLLNFVNDSRTQISTEKSDLCVIIVDTNLWDTRWRIRVYRLPKTVIPQKSPPSKTPDFFHNKSRTKPIIWWQKLYRVTRKLEDITHNQTKRSEFYQTIYMIWRDRLLIYAEFCLKLLFFFLNLFVSSHSFIEPQTKI